VDNYAYMSIEALVETCASSEHRGDRESAAKELAWRILHGDRGDSGAMEAQHHA
jgi:hypothetical protein